MSKARDLANAGTALGAVTATELGYVDGVTSAIQTQIDSKITGSSAISPTIVDAKGDIIAATAADTVARLAVGANDTVLTADSTASTGLKWATPAAGGMTLLSTTTLSGATTTISSIDQTYTHLDIFIDQYKPATDAALLQMRFNADGSANRYKRWGTNSTINGGSAGYNFDSTENDITAGVDNSVATNFIRLFIPFYTSSTVWRQANFWALTVDPTTTTSFGYFAGISAYNQTTAISSLLFKPNTGNFTSGTVYIYGVK